MKCRDLLRNDFDLDEFKVSSDYDLTSLLEDLVEDETNIRAAALDDNAEEVATYIAGYIGRQMSS